MNKKFGKLINGVLIYAPKSLNYKGSFYINPMDNIYLDLGYKYIKETVLEEKEGYTVEEAGYDEDELNIFKIYNYVQIAEDNTDKPFNISKLSLRIELSKLGIFEKIELFMREINIDLGNNMVVNLYDCWKDCLTINTGYPLFQQYLGAFKEKFKDYITPEEVDAMILRCKSDLN